MKFCEYVPRTKFCDIFQTLWRHNIQYDDTERNDIDLTKFRIVTLSITTHNVTVKMFHRMSQ
jgi:hypothetical protein